MTCLESFIKLLTARIHQGNKMSRCAWSFDTACYRCQSHFTCRLSSTPVLVNYLCHASTLILEPQYNFVREFKTIFSLFLDSSSTRRSVCEMYTRKWKAARERLHHEGQKRFSGGLWGLGAEGVSGGDMGVSRSAAPPLEQQTVSNVALSPKGTASWEEH